MRLPIKLNQAGWPSLFSRLSFTFEDPRILAQRALSLSPAEFSAAVSCLQFGITFKTTRPGRQGHSDRFVRDAYCGSKPVILDVGASDGSTSLDLLRALGSDFAQYSVTDLNLFARCGSDRLGNIYFLDEQGACILRASKRFLIYADLSGAHFPLTFIAKLLLDRYRGAANWCDVPLIQPELRRLAAIDSRIAIKRYDIFSPWDGERPDLIKVGCLLYGDYFSEARMKQALRIQCSNLAPDGRLLLVSEDDEVERFSVFRKGPTGMELEHTHLGGAKAAPYVPANGGH
jgi:hypothetical protein